LEHLRSIVDDGIDARPLLEEHDQPCSGDTLEVTSSPQDLVVLRKLVFKDTVSFFSSQVRKFILEISALEQCFCLDLQRLDLDELMLYWLLPEIWQSLRIDVNHPVAAADSTTHGKLSIKRVMTSDLPRTPCW
jgi:hypothetical protein